MSETRAAVLYFLGAFIALLATIAITAPNTHCRPHISHTPGRAHYILVCR